jgi:hypothetical protein
VLCLVETDVEASAVVSNKNSVGGVS